MADSNDVALVSDREAIAAELDARFSLGAADTNFAALLLIIVAVMIPFPAV